MKTRDQALRRPRTTSFGVHNKYIMRRRY